MGCSFQPSGPFLPFYKHEDSYTQQNGKYTNPNAGYYTKDRTKASKTCFKKIPVCSNFEGQSIPCWKDARWKGCPTPEELAILWEFQERRMRIQTVYLNLAQDLHRCWKNECCEPFLFPHRCLIEECAAVTGSKRKVLSLEEVTGNKFYVQGKHMLFDEHMFLAAAVLWKQRKMGSWLRGRNVPGVQKVLGSVPGISRYSWESFLPPEVPLKRYSW